MIQWILWILCVALLTTHTVMPAWLHLTVTILVWAWPSLILLYLVFCVLSIKINSRGDKYKIQTKLKDLGAVLPNKNKH